VHTLEVVHGTEPDEVPGIIVAALRAMKDVMRVHGGPAAARYLTAAAVAVEDPSVGRAPRLQGLAPRLDEMCRG